MNTIRYHYRITLFVIATALMFQLSSVSAEDRKPNHDRKGVQIHFTKWVLEAQSFPLPMMGFIRGQNIGSFVGEFLAQDAEPSKTFGILRIEAIYRVVSGNRSFTALLKGGASVDFEDGGIGALDGVILAGWRAGAPVHVQFKPTSCSFAPGGVCFEGTIEVH